MGHARLAPSGWDRWSVCPAAPDREAQYPDEDNPASIRGTRIHALGESYLREEPFVDPIDGTWEPDSEAEWMAVAYRDYINRRRDEMGPTALRIEEKVDPGSYIGRNDCAGTADAMIVSHEVLEVVDLKTGGKLVEADSGQIKLYALGALYQYMDNGKVPFDRVRLTIFQPRRPSIEGPIERYVEMTPDDLLTWATLEFESAATATDEDPPAVPDEDACKFCKARHDCPERAAMIQEQTAVLAEGDGDAFDILMSSERVDSLTPDQLARILDAAPLIQARLKDVEERATTLAKDHVQVPGFKLVRGQSSRKWGLDSEELTKKLKNLKLKKGQIYEEKLRSPAQMQKLGLPVDLWQKVEKYIVKPEGKLTLVPESDSRENAMPALEFQPINETEPSEPSAALPDFLL